jgi:hypothetical protein
MTVSWWVGWGTKEPITIGKFGAPRVILGEFCYYMTKSLWPMV